MLDTVLIWQGREYRLWQGEWETRLGPRYKLGRMTVQQVTVVPPNVSGFLRQFDCALRGLYETERGPVRVTQSADDLAGTPA